MTKKKYPPLNFTSEVERRQWIIDNADYFTVIKRVNLQNVRVERKTLQGAVAFAERAVKVDKGARILIYAVAGESSDFVKAVNKYTVGGLP